ncbi:hypothetical protein [Clostridium sp.]|uniref:hypothetical protein n=1 Tax=Clostridium sp. TaxID=1506 RepID=UPI0026277A3C
MLCERCNKNSATIQLLKSINGKKESLMLCDKCVIEIMSFALENDDISLEDFLIDLNTYIDFIEEIAKDKELVCSNCGTRFVDFEDDNLLGCEKCYEVFKNRVGFLLNSQESNIKHKGKQPKTIKKDLKKLEILNLQEKFKINILKEEYEEAIITRKKIHDLKEIIREDSNSGSVD